MPGASLASWQTTTAKPCISCPKSRHHRHGLAQRGTSIFAACSTPASRKNTARSGHALVNQDASGEFGCDGHRRVALGLYNQTGSSGRIVQTPIHRLSIRLPAFSMQMISWMPGSPVFDKARATGLRVADWQDLILVNMQGSRFYDETQGGLTANNFGSVKLPAGKAISMPRTCNTIRATSERPLAGFKRRTQRRWSHLGDLRCQCRCARALGSQAAQRRFQGGLLLQRRHAGRN